MKNHYKKIVEVTEKSLDAILANQDMNEKSPCFGGYINPETGLLDAISNGCVHGTDVMISLYYNVDSKYYRNEGLLYRALLMLRQAAAHQNSDGTLNQLSSNYRCACASAFAAEIFAFSYKILKKHMNENENENESESKSENKTEKEIEKLLYDYIVKAGNAMIHGGFHTPNHRWVISGAMALVYGITKNNELLTAINRYLQEGVDQNSDGEYTEKSIGGYDAVINMAFIHLNNELNEPAYLEYVRNNLKLVPLFFQPDGSLFTKASKRGDKTSLITPLIYYPSYLLMAYKLKDASFAFIANEIFLRYIFAEGKTISDRNLLSYYMLYECLKDYEPVKMKPYSVKSENWLKETGIVRITDKNRVITLLENNPDFMHYQIFDVSEQTIYKEMKEGKFGIPIKMGRAYKVPKIYVLQRYFCNH